MTKRWKKGLFISGLFLFALITTLSVTPARAQLFNGPVDKLPVEERVALKNGKTVVTGAEGNYVGKVLIKSQPDAVWSVLTDYNNFSKFLPNVISSQLLESQGNRKVVEQVSKRRVFVVSVESRIRTENVETAKEKIDFRLLEGDLSQLQGAWKIEPVSDYPTGPITQVLITQEVAVKPKSGTPENIFYDIFKGAMNDNLQAINQEVMKRMAAK